MFDLCRSNPNALLDRTLNSDEEKWEMSAFEGEWIRGVTSGGMYPEEGIHIPYKYFGDVLIKCDSIII